MLHSVTNGALRGAIAGAAGGLLLWVVVKVFKLEGYLGGKKTPSVIPTVPPLPPPPPYAPTETNAWSGDSVYPPRPVLGDVPSPAPTQTALIAVMWGLIALVVLLSFFGFPSVLLICLDVPALIIAIILLFKRNAVNRWNGGTNLAIGFVTILILVSSQRSTEMPTIQTFPGLSGVDQSPVGSPMPGQIAPPPAFPHITEPNIQPPSHFGGPPMPSMPR